MCHAPFMHRKCNRACDKVPTLMELILFSERQNPQHPLAVAEEQLLLLGSQVAPVVYCSSPHSLEILVCPNIYQLLLFQFPAWPLWDFKFKPSKPQLYHHRVRTCWLSTVRTSMISGPQPHPAGYSLWLLKDLINQALWLGHMREETHLDWAGVTANHNWGTSEV